MGRAKVLELIDPLVVSAPPSLQVRARVGAAARIRLGLELRARARVHLLVVGAPLALRITLVLTALGRREEGTVGAEDDVAPVVPVPPRVLHPLEVLAHALDRTACGTCVSGVASGAWVDVEAVGVVVGVCEASRGRDGVWARNTFLRAALALDEALPVQAGTCHGGIQLATGTCCGRDCRGAAAAHRCSSVPSGQTEVTLQSVSPFLAAPTSATSAKRHPRTTIVVGVLAVFSVVASHKGGFLRGFG